MLSKVIKHYPEFDGIHPACLAMPEAEAEDYQTLVDDISKNGLLEDLAMTPDRKLLDGRTRLLACYEAKVEIRVKTISGDPWRYVASANIARRHLSVGQKAMFGLKFKEAIAAEAKKRLVAVQIKGREKGGKPVGSGKSITTEKGKTRDQVGKVVGVSGASIDKAAMIEAEAPDLAEKVKKGSLSLEAAHKEARKIKKSKKPVPKTPKSSKSLPKVEVVCVDGRSKKIEPPKRPVFNRTNENIDWAAFSWNPVTGCQHGCEFCYAREIANKKEMQRIYPLGFETTFYEHRLAAPKNTKPIDGAHGSRVFVCSMADLFGKWVPKEWIERVFATCAESPEWTYIFLTKNPKRYAKLTLPADSWFGATVASKKSVRSVEKAMASFNPGKNSVRWVSLEPMTEAITFNDLSWCDLVVIGAQTDTVQPGGKRIPAFAPKFDWVVDVVNQCREANVPYYLKPNLGLLLPGMDLPRMMRRGTNE
jgi:protein gp37